MLGIASKAACLRGLASGDVCGPLGNYTGITHDVRIDSVRL